MYKLLCVNINKPALWILGYTFILTYNVLFYDNPSVSLFLTILQLLYLVILLLTGEIRVALLFHLLFSILSFDQSTMALDEGVMYSYAKLKALGPVSFFHIITFFIWFLTFKNFKFRPQNSLLYEIQKTMLILCALGTIIGGIGLVLWNYPLEYFIDPLRYIIPGILICDTFLLLYKNEYIRLFYYASIYLLIASCISAFLTFFVFNMKVEYSVDETFISNEMYYLFPSILVGIIMIKNKEIQYWMIFSIILFFVNMLGGGRGMTILTTIMALSFMVYVIYFCKDSVNVVGKVMRGALPFVVLIVLSIGLTISGSDLFNRKLEQVISLFGMFWGDGDFTERLLNVSSSPFIRIAEFINMLDQGIDNIPSLIFGRGYGGGYTDSTGLFTFVRLENGAFSDEMIASGIFYKAHSAIPCSMLYNGLIGLFFIFKMSWKYAKKVHENFLAFGGFILFIYTFYFNPLFLVSGLFLCFGAEYQLKNKH